MISKTIELKSMKEKYNNIMPLLYLLIAFVSGLVLALYKFACLENDNYYVVLLKQTISDLQFLSYSALIFNIVFCILIFISGFFMLSKPFLILYLFIFSFAQGILLAIADRDNLLLYILFYMIPSTLFSVAHLSAAFQSMLFGDDIYNLFFKNVPIKTKIRTYLKKYALIGLIICSGGVLMLIVAITSVGAIL